MTDRFIVDFAGVGVAKAGTSWIAQCLGEHPQICMALGKETNYFTLHHVGSVMPVKGRYRGRSNYELGLDWYKSRYAHYEPGQLRGEFSVNYIGDPDSPRLLKEHNPDMRLVFSFRNPVDVLYSGYHQLSRVQPIHESFEESLDRYPGFLDYARHYSNLQNFLAEFPAEQMHFVVFEDIANDGPAVFRRLCRFLAVDDSFESEIVTRKVNPRTVLRSTVVRDLRCAIASVFGKTDFLRRLKMGLWRLGPGRVVMKLFELNEQPGSVAPMRPETRERLVNEFGPDVERLSAFLDRDLSAWQQT